MTTQPTITVTEGIDHLLITNSSRPTTAWRVTNHKLLDTFTSDRDFFVVEVLDGFATTALMSVEFDPRRNRLSLRFCEDLKQGAYLNIAIHDTAAAFVPMVIETPESVFEVLYSRSKDAFIGEVPKSPLKTDAFRALLNDIDGPVRAWLESGDTGYAPDGIIFQKSNGGGKKKKCDKLGGIKATVFGFGALGALLGAGLVALAGDFKTAGTLLEESGKLGNKAEDADKKSCKDKEAEKPPA